MRVDQALRRHAAAHPRARAIARQQGLHGHCDQAVTAQIADQRRSRIEIGALESMLEMDRHPRLTGGDLDQSLVELMPRDGEDQLVGPLSVGLKRRAAPLMMNEPPAHRQQRVLEILEHAGRLQRMNASIGQREIDGSA